VSFVETNVFGVYVAPIVPMMIVALLITLTLRWLALALGLFRWVWHPALFQFWVYLIVLTAVVVSAGALKLNI
jgi:hypothetical protein